MEWSDVAIAAVVGGAVAAASAPGLIAILRRAQAFDRPSDRSSHERPTLRGGGASVVIGSLAGVLVGWRYSYVLVARHAGPVAARVGTIAAVWATPIAWYADRSNRVRIAVLLWRGGDGAAEGDKGPR